jgi:ABC-type multidrug transport system permease subunit
MSNTQYSPEGSPWPPQDNGYSYQQPPYYQQQQQASGYPYGQQPVYQIYQPVVVQQNNDNGTIVLVMGILSMVFTGPIGLILGIVGLVMANKARQLPMQSGLTTAGRVCSIVGIVMSAFALVFIVLYFLFIFAMLGGMFTTMPR